MIHKRYSKIDQQTLLRNRLTITQKVDLQTLLKSDPQLLLINLPTNVTQKVIRKRFSALSKEHETHKMFKDSNTFIILF